MEEVNKGCSKFCVTVDIVTRTAGILIHRQLNALAVHFVKPAIQLICKLDLTTLASSKQTLLSAQILLLPHGCERVDVTSCTGLPG